MAVLSLCLWFFLDSESAKIWLSRISLVSFLFSLGGYFFLHKKSHLSFAGEKAKARGINSEGLKRRGYTSEQIQQVKRAYKLLYRSGKTMDEARDELAVVVPMHERTHVRRDPDFDRRARDEVQDGPRGRHSEWLFRGGVRVGGARVGEELDDDVVRADGKRGDAERYDGMAVVPRCWVRRLDQQVNFEVDRGGPGRHGRAGE